MQHSNSTVVVLIDLSAVGHGGVPLIYRETLTKQFSASVVVMSGKLGKLLKQLYLSRAIIRGLSFTMSRLVLRGPENTACCSK